MRIPFPKPSIAQVAQNVRHSRIYSLTKRFISIAGRNEYIESGKASLQINLDFAIIKHMSSATTSGDLDLNLRVSLDILLLFIFPPNDLIYLCIDQHTTHANCTIYSR